MEQLKTLKAWLGTELSSYELRKKMGVALALFVAMWMSRILWVSYPGMLFCAALWAFALVLFVHLLRLRGSVIWRASWTITVLGTISNATATLANGGFMPNIYSEGGIYVLGGRLLFLGDCYHGASLGDFLIFLGMLVFMICTLRLCNGRLTQFKENEKRRMSGLSSV